MGQASCVELHEHDALVDFRALPVEIVLRILDYLSAGDLCMISLLNSQWHRVANLDLIWKRQCERRIPGMDELSATRLQLKWKQIFIMAQSFVYCFNMRGERGLGMFLEMGLIQENPETVALFLYRTKHLNKLEIGRLLTDPSRRDTMMAFVRLQPVRNVFMGEALRDFLKCFDFPKALQMSQYVIVEKFAEHYWQCNRDKLTYSQETAVLLFFSVMLLSTDLNSPHVKNKMTKREFIRNLRSTITAEVNTLSTDYLGLIYDFVFLQGVIEPPATGNTAQSKKQQRVCHTVVSQMSQNRFRPWVTTPRLLTL